MEKVIKLLNRVSLALVGYVGSHYVVEFLSRKAAREQAEILNKVTETHEKVSFLEDVTKHVESKEIRTNVLQMTKENPDIVINQLRDSNKFTEEFMKEVEKFSEHIPLESKARLGDIISKFVSGNERLIKFVEEINQKSDKFVSNLAVGPVREDFYKYLDSLTLLQESSLLHVIFILCIMFTMSNIFAVLFGNEIIKYFNLENKFPSLATLFMYRAKFQKYYLVWNIFILYSLCIGFICLDLFVFING